MQSSDAIISISSLELMGMRGGDQQTMTGNYDKLDWKPYSRVILNQRSIRDILVMLTICHMQSATKYMTRQQLHACFQI